MYGVVVLVLMLLSKSIISEPWQKALPIDVMDLFKTRYDNYDIQRHPILDHTRRGDSIITPFCSTPIAVFKVIVCPFLITYKFVFPLRIMDSCNTSITEQHA